MKLEPQQLTNFTNGLISKNAISESQMPTSVVNESVNFHFDKIGACTLRQGTTLLGNQLSGDILGLHEFRDSGAGTNNQIIAVNGTVAYYLSSGTWTSKRTGLTSGSKADFTTFLDFVWMVNGTEATAIWDGNSSNAFLTSGNALNAPTGKYIENYRSRVWITGNTSYPDRVYYSSLPSAVTTPIVTWDTSVTTGDWIDISPQDGDNITGMARDKNALLVFKHNYIYRLYSINETEPDPKINVGTYSNRSIVIAKDGIYFHHPTGIYRYSEGSVQDISTPIIDFIKNVTVSQYEEVTGWTDGDHIYHSLGDITIGDTAYTNVVSRYTISSKVWTIYSYPSEFLVASNYNDGTTLFRLVGDDNGNILKVNVGKTDNGASIFYSAILRPYTLDGLYSTRKIISKMSIIHENGEGALVTYKKDNDKDNEWKKVCQIDNPLAKPFTTDIRGNKIYFRVQGSSIGEPFTFNGLELLDVSSELIS